MADYTSTFTEVDGVDDVEAADFSTEFDAIETAIATKTDETSGTLTSPTITSPTINGKPSYGLVILDAHESLATGSAAVGSWTQLDMSAGGTEAVAAAAAGAVKAVLKVFIQITEGVAGTSGNGSVYIQKNSLGGALGVGNIAAQAIATMDAASSTSVLGKHYTTVIVNLDANSDFEYQVANTGTAISWSIDLVGYYT